MAMIRDEQHAAYDQQQQANIANISLGSQRTAFDQQQASSSNYVPQQGRKAYTEVCGIFAPSLQDPPLQLSKPKGENSFENPQYHCPRCDSIFSRSDSVKQHFPRCVAINGNPGSLRWFDHASNKISGWRKRKKLKATVNSSKRKRSGFPAASLLEDEPAAVMAMSKVGKWAAMAEEKQAPTVVTSNNLDGAGPLATHNWTTVTASNMDTSNLNDSPAAKTPAMTPTATLKEGRPLATFAARDESVMPASRQQQPKTPKRGKSRRPTHDLWTAHLFNNAGVLMPVSQFLE